MKNIYLDSEWNERSIGLVMMFIFFLRKRFFG